MHSIVSYPDRGRWGNARYRGNCSGHLLCDLLGFYRPRNVVDPAEGGGTSRDVCRFLNIPYRGFDLREGFDLTTMPLIERLPRPTEFVFFHPPYFRIIRYSGNVWGESAHAADLSHVNDWSEYLEQLRRMVDNCLDAMVEGGHVAILIGDVRHRGAYYSAQAFLHLWYGPAAVTAALVKHQHNVTSGDREYAGRLIRIMHEFVVVLRRTPSFTVAATPDRCADTEEDGRHG